MRGLPRALEGVKKSRLCRLLCGRARDFRAAGLRLSSLGSAACRKAVSFLPRPRRDGRTASGAAASAGGQRFFHTFLGPGLHYCAPLGLSKALLRTATIYCRSFGAKRFILCRRCSALPRFETSKDDIQKHVERNVLRSREVAEVRRGRVVINVAWIQMVGEVVNGEGAAERVVSDPG